MAFYSVSGVTFTRVIVVCHQGLIDPRSGERACNSAYACRDGKMLVVTKNRTKRVGGSCLYSLAKGFGPFLRGYGQALEKGMVTSNHQHFAVSTGICGVACNYFQFWIRIIEGPVNRGPDNQGSTVHQIHNTNTLLIN